MWPRGEKCFERCSGVELRWKRPRGEARWKKVMWGKSKGHWRIVGKYAARMLRERGEAKRKREEQGVVT